MGDLNIKEIFYSIQGEGPYAGRPAWFIRLAECPLRCAGCDTDFLQGQMMSVESIIAALGDGDEPGSTCTLVVITGGEPLAQDISELIRSLTFDYNYYTQIETSGVVCHYGNFKMLNDVVVVCSPKTPNIAKGLAEFIDYYKYVCCVSDLDINGLPKKMLSATDNKHMAFRDEEMLQSDPGRIYLSPMDMGNDEDNQSNLKFVADVCMKYGWNLTIQMHKLIGLR